MALHADQKELVFSLSITAISAALLLRSFAYPAESSNFPRFLTALMLFFSLILLVKDIRERNASSAATQKSAEAPRATGSSSSFRTAFLVFAGTALYAGAIQYIGYFVSTTVFFVGMMTLFGKHRLWVSFCSSAAFMLAMYALFVKFLGLRLPEGLLF